MMSISALLLYPFMTEYASGWHSTPTKFGRYLIQGYIMGQCKYGVALGLLAIASLSVLTGCITSDVTSYRDPFFNGQAKKRFLIIMETGTPQSIEQMEELAVGNIDDYGLTAVPFTKVVPPVRKYTDEEMVELLQRVKVEAYMRIRMQGTNTAEVHVPSLSYSAGQATAYGNKATGRSATITTGGYSRSEVAGLRYECEVEDAVTLKTIWTCNILINVNAKQNFRPVDYFDEVFEVIA